MDESIKQEVIKNLGLEHLNPEEQDAILNRLYELILRELNLAIAARLTDEERVMVDQLSDLNLVDEYIRSKILDYDHLVATTAQMVMADFKKPVAA
jgi:hypothetical protein